MSSIVVFTLMRKGSQRFINKVKNSFLGLPLYMHTVNFAKALGYKYYLIHDYDDIPEINNVVQIKRHEYFAGDTHKTNEELLTYINNGQMDDADIFIFLQATSPIRDLWKVQKWINYFIDSNLLCGVAVADISSKYCYNGNGEGINFNIGDRTDNGCKKSELYIETGKFFIFRKEQLFKKHILDAVSPCKALFIDNNFNMDIDYKEDLESIESRLK